MKIQPITKVTPTSQITFNPDVFSQILTKSIHNTKYYIVPIKRNTHHLRVIIPALSSQAAYQLAKEEFECDNWIVDLDYRNYKIL